MERVGVPNSETIISKFFFKSQLFQPLNKKSHFMKKSTAKFIVGLGLLMVVFVIFLGALSGKDRFPNRMNKRVII